MKKMILVLSLMSSMMLVGCMHGRHCDQSKGTCNLERPCGCTPEKMKAAGCNDCSSKEAAKPAEKK